MRKSIDFTEKDVETISEYQEKNGLRNFSKAVRNMIRKDKGLSDENFALLADAIVKLDEKIEAMMIHIAPKSAGEIK